MVFLTFLVCLALYFVGVSLLAPLALPPLARTAYRWFGIALWWGTIVSGLAALF